MLKKYQNKIIELNYSYSDKMFKIYLESLKINIEKLSENSIKEIVKLLRADLDKSLIDVNLVSSICHELWNIALNVLDLKYTTFIDFLYDASELSYRQKIFNEQILTGKNVENDVFITTLREFMTKDLTSTSIEKVSINLNK